MAERVERVIERTRTMSKLCIASEPESLNQEGSGKVNKVDGHALVIIPDLML